MGTAGEQEADMPSKAKRRKRAEPGAILRYHSRPRHRGEILCHNHVLHIEGMDHGRNGFRWFTCKRGGHWQPCPCGWRPDLGKHYARPDHVRHQRQRIKRGEPATMWCSSILPGFRQVGRKLDGGYMIAPIKPGLRMREIWR
jgi:hypothetical protein